MRPRARAGVDKPTSPQAKRREGAKKESQLAAGITWMQGRPGGTATDHTSRQARIGRESSSTCNTA